MMIVAVVLILVLIELTIPSVSYAWGPGMHVYIGTSALKFAKDLIPAAAVVLENNPLHYLYGCLSADIFFGKTGKSTKQKCHTWVIGQKLLEISKDDKGRAYAYGFLSHLAADTVAHNICLPYFMSLDSKSKKWQHCFWEWQFDRVLAYEYRLLAKEVFSHSFTEVDRTLCSLTNVKFPVFWTKKILYARTLGGKVREKKSVSSMILYACLAYQHKNLLHLKKSVSLSLVSVLDVLNDPESAACTKMDPLGNLS